MADVFEELAGLNRLIHEPARLSILTALLRIDSADFTSLQKLTGLSVGNLSAHLSKLEDAGLVESEKTFVNKRPNTLVRLTPEGKTAIEAHWKQLEYLHNGSQQWRPEEEEDRPA